MCGSRVCDVERDAELVDHDAQGGRIRVLNFLGGEHGRGGIESSMVYRCMRGRRR